MSNLILSKAFQADGLSSTQKFVLVSLADQANDNGVCWPSISLIQKRTCLSRTAVKDAVKSLLSAGILTVHYRKSENKVNKTSVYRVNIDQITVEQPSKSERALDAEVLQIPELEDLEGVATRPRVGRETTGGRSPDDLGWVASRPQTIIEPKENPKGTNKATRPRSGACTVAKPDEVTQQVWDDFLQTRKAKRSPLTKTALDAIEREAMKAGFSLQNALRECTARGWQGFKAEWVAKPIKPGQPTHDENQAKHARAYQAIFGEPMQAREA